MAAAAASYLMHFLLERGGVFKACSQMPNVWAGAPSIPEGTGGEAHAGDGGAWLGHGGGIGKKKKRDWESGKQEFLVCWGDDGQVGGGEANPGPRLTVPESFHSLNRA